MHAWHQQLSNLLLVLFCRPTAPGPFALNLCWCYEPLVKLEALPYRTLRATFTASVVPSLEATASLGPAAGPSDARLFMLRGLNLHGLNTFELRQLAFLGGGWSATLAGQSGGGEAEATGALPLEHSLAPESAVTLHVHLKKRASESGLEKEEGASAAECHLAASGAAPPRGGGASLQALLRWEAAGLPGSEPVYGFSIVRAQR